MRRIINISLPQELTKVVEKEIKKGKYSSTSEFFRDLLRKWMNEELYYHVAQSERELRAGKGRKLRSLKDLR